MSFGHYHEKIDNIDVRGDGVVDGERENDIKAQAKEYIENQIKNGISPEGLDELLKQIQVLLERQDVEKNTLREQLKESISQETSQTRESLSQEALIHEAKMMLYTSLGIGEDLETNGVLKNFFKGIIDCLVIGNIELSLEIWETNGQVLLDALGQLTSWEGLKNIALSLGDTVMSLFQGNAYEKGKSVAEMGLIGTGLGVGIALGRKGVKAAIKKLHGSGEEEKEEEKKKEKTSSIIPSQKSNTELPKMDVQEMLIDDIARLSDGDRLEVADVFLGGKVLTPQQQNAIIEAHRVGEAREGAGIFNYTPEELKQKIQILKDAGFEKSERKLLLQKGICGKISDEKLTQGELAGETLGDQVDTIHALAEATRKDYDSLLQEIGGESHSSKVLDSQSVPLKGKKDVLKKIEGEYEGKNPEKIRDVLRGSVVYDDLDDLRHGLELFKKSDKITEIHITDRLHKLNTNDILLNIRFPNGFVAEVQLHIRETLHAKETGLKIDKSIIDLATLWTPEERQLVQEIKDGKRGTRTLDPQVNLPTNEGNVSGHHLYEIRRNLGKTSLENTLRQKLVDVDDRLNLMAREMYSERTGKPFE